MPGVKQKGGLKPPSMESEEEARKAGGQGVVFVLDDAQLEVAQVGKVRIINRDDMAISACSSIDDSLLLPGVCASQLR